MSLSYWGESLTSATYLVNQIPSSTLDFKTPFQNLTKVMIALPIPNLPPRVFGCVVFVHLHKHKHTKLIPQALQCVFLSYVTHQKGYQCYNPPTYTLFVTMDVVFHEDTMYFPEPELQGKYRKEIQTLDYSENNQDVVNLDSSGITLDLSDDNVGKNSLKIVFSFINCLFI